MHASASFDFRSQSADQRVPLGFIETRQGFGARRVADDAQQREARVRFGREIEQPGAPVVRVLATLDETTRLQLVENSHQRDGLHLQDVGEAGLVDPFILREMDQHLPLRSGKAEPNRALLEPPSHEPRDVVQEKPYDR